MMTPGTSHRDATERLQGRSHHVIPIKMPCDLAIDLGFRNFNLTNEIPRSRGDEARSQNTFGIVCRKNISRKLLSDKLGRRTILIERTDDIVAIGPSVGPGLIFVIPMRVAVMDDIQPVPPPTLTIPGRCKQTIDKFLKRSWVGIRGKLLNLLGTGR